MGTTLGDSRFQSGCNTLDVREVQLGRGEWLVCRDLSGGSELCCGADERSKGWERDLLSKEEGLGETGYA